MNRPVFFTVLLLGCLLTFPEISSAQGGGPPPPPQPSPAVPIDGGLGILMAAGVGLAVKKVWDKKKHR